mgnify:FL=1
MYRGLWKSWWGGKSLSKKLNGLFDNIAKQNADLSKVEVIESPEDKLAILSQYKFTFGAD